MKCKDCPVRGYTYRDGKEIQNLCCCAGHTSTVITDPEHCMYGIEDYNAYWEDLLVRNGWVHEGTMWIQRNKPKRANQQS